MRNFNFQTGEYYHIYNRGVDRRDIFMDAKDYVRFIRSMREFNKIEPTGSLYKISKLKTSDVFKRHRMSSLVDFVCYSLLPNHYHFLVKQLVDNGIPKFMRRIGDGYTKYFNYRYNRSGVLFQGKFKRVEVKKYSHFLRLAVYINCNSEVHGIKKAENWPWSSYLDCINKRNGDLCNKDMILNEFKNINEFKNFCIQVLPDIIEIKELKSYLLE